MSYHTFFKVVALELGTWALYNCGNEWGDDMPYVPVEKDRRKKGDQAKKIFIKMRVTHAERENIKCLADQRGITMSEMIRDFLFQDGVNEDKTR